MNGYKDPVFQEEKLLVWAWEFLHLLLVDMNKIVKWDLSSFTINEFPVVWDMKFLWLMKQMDEESL